MRVGVNAPGDVAPAERGEHPGDNSALPDQAKRHFAVVPTLAKLHLRPETPHLAFYDDPTAIDPTVTGITDWLARHLGPGARS